MDRRRIVTLNGFTGAATTVKDLEIAPDYYSERGTFQVTAGNTQAIQAVRARRYGGSRAVGATDDNGTIAYRCLVKGTSRDNALINAEAIFAILKTGRTDLFFEWRPDGATNSTFYEIRGPASVKATYNWGIYMGSSALFIDVEIPVGPLARVAPVQSTISSTALPATLTVASVAGSAPHVVDVGLSGPATGNPPIWAMIGWTPTPGTPLGSMSVPFGIIESSALNLTTFTSQASGSYSGGTAARATAAGNGLAAASVNVDPTTLAADDFTRDTIDIQVWARVILTSTLVSPQAILSVGGGIYGTQYGELGANGRYLVLPTTGTVLRFTYLGTITLPTKHLALLGWTVTVAMAWQAGSTGQVGIDYLAMVPARSVALSPTGKDPGAIGPFISAVSTSKRIYGGDLSGEAFQGVGIDWTTVMGRSSGLGGSLIEVPPNTGTNYFIKLSSLVPDAPTASAASEDLSHTCTGFFSTMPRYYLAK
ncbi:MAG: hypothetical protein H0W81_06520 [Chloroflexi bacterium]|nr:hypothetical protein [Chloroflexota bacterium]